MIAEGASDQDLSSGLVLVDITPKANSDGIRRITEFMKTGIDGFDSLDEAGAAIAAYTPQRVREVNRAGLAKVLRQRDGRWYWHWGPSFMEQSHTEVMSEAFANLLGVAASNIHVPTMLVRGLLCDVVTQDGVDDLLARIPGAEIVEVRDASHMIAGDQNDAFSDAVVSFLRNRIQSTASM
jgi:pimeloyl-ACP methyl ester carboxylesterase